MSQRGHTIEIITTRQIGKLTLYVVDVLPGDHAATGHTCVLDPHRLTVSILYAATIPALVAEIHAVLHPIYSNMARGAMGLAPHPDALADLRDVTVVEWMGLALT